jgi:hypothetical protein
MVKRSQDSCCRRQQQLRSIPLPGKLNHSFHSTINYPVKQLAILPRVQWDELAI